MRKTSLLDSFVQKTAQEKRIDVQKFWKMREFYCPGSSVFDKAKNPFLVYQCPWMKSEDYLISQDKKTLLFPKEQVRILNDEKTIRISFSVSAEEMKKAVGYFDYNEKDKNLVKGKYWMNITAISRK